MSSHNPHPLRAGTLIPALIMVCLTMTGCGLGLTDSITQTREAAGDILADSISKLGNESAEWRDVLDETSDRLIRAGQSTLANEVSDVASRAGSDLGIEARCYTDFLRDRTRAALIRLRGRVTGETVVLEPMFCNPTPNSVNLALPLDRRPTIEIAGFNLDAASIQVFTVGGGTRKDVTSHLATPSEYLLTLNLGVNGVPLGAEVNQLEFALPGGARRTVTVVQPPPPPPKPDFPVRSLHLFGRIDLNDDENFGADENLSVPVDAWVRVEAGRVAAFHWDRCVGGEVHGYLDLSLQLDRATGTIAASGIAQYYEGTSCGRTNLHGQRPVTFALAPGRSQVLQATMSDSDGAVAINLTAVNG